MPAHEILLRWVNVQLSSLPGGEGPKQSVSKRQTPSHKPNALNSEPQIGLGGQMWESKLV